MRYTTEIEIEKPIERVVELFDNADNLKKWMEGLQSYEHISGTPGETGAKSRLFFKIEMIETILVRNLPEEFSATYEAKGVFNNAKNKFVKVSETSTKYITENEFQFKGFMKFFAFLMPGAFKKQSFKYLQHFKNFAESQD